MLPSGFELQKYKIVVKPDGCKKTELETLPASFGEETKDPWQVMVKLPPQANEVKGKLMVQAEYGGGRVVVSKSCTVDFPQYGMLKKSLLCLLAIIMLCAHQALRTTHFKLPNYSP